MHGETNRPRRGGAGGRGLMALVLAAAGGCAHPTPAPEIAPAPAPMPAAPGEAAADDPALDVALGEHAWPNEDALSDAIGAAIEQSIRRRYRPGEARRDAHPKAHGCVQARFEVAPRLPPALAQGIFVPGASYPAIVRFSNGSPDASRADTKGDARGMAIKVLDVPGPKLLAAERGATTQDFIMINHPVFFANDPARYRSFIERADSASTLDKLGIPLALGFRGTLIAFETTRSRIASPLQARYWSMVPYRLGVGPGRQAVKFSAQPCRLEDVEIPEHPGPDYLRAALRERLHRGEACMEFLVQPRTADSQSVEDSMTEWPEADAPFHRVARLRIPAQDFDTPAQNQACENLAFTPWHSLPAHRPLGVVNRLRRGIYERISRLRHALNGVAPAEP